MQAGRLFDEPVGEFTAFAVKPQIAAIRVALLEVTFKVSAITNVGRVISFAVSETDEGESGL